MEKCPLGMASPLSSSSLAECGRVGIDAAETFDLLVADLTEHLQDLVPGLEVAGAVELE